MQPATKQTLRTIFKQKRLEIIKTKSTQITHQLAYKLKVCIDTLQTRKDLNINIIGSYFPDVKRQIIPPQPQRYQYAFPYFAKKGKDGLTPLMQFKVYQKQTNDLQQNYGIKVPPKQLPTVFPELILVPLLCFSAQSKQRIGYGGGYYDRYISFSRQQNHPTVFIGIGLQVLKTQQDFKSDNDQHLDFIITETHIY